MNTPESVHGVAMPPAARGAGLCLLPGIINTNGNYERATPRSLPVWTEKRAITPHTEHLPSGLGGLRARLPTPPGFHIRHEQWDSGISSCR